jgi:hypothetical protein
MDAAEGRPLGSEDLSRNNMVELDFFLDVQTTIIHVDITVKAHTPRNYFSSSRSRWQDASETY